MLYQNHLKKIYSLLVLMTFAYWANAQVVSYTPTYPTPQDTVEIIFDASAGNGALSGISPVYAHTGAISENSLSSADWKHRINPWPTGDPDLVIIDSLVDMEDLGNNLHRIRIKPVTYYGFNSLIEYNAMAFVFRDFTGSNAGKNADGTDIFIPLFQNGFDALFFSPLTNGYRANLNDNIPIEILANESSTIKFYHDGVLISQSSNTDTHTETIQASSPGKHWLKLEATNAGGTTIMDSIYYIVSSPLTVQDPPFASQNGINYVDDTTVLLQLYAPGKNFAYVIGDFNDWQVDPAYEMNQTVDGTAFWIEITGLTPGQEYRFQYNVDNDVIIADPWAEKYLSEFNDINILPFTYPNLIDYPTGKTHGMVSIFETAQTPYNWQVQNFQRPLNQDLVIYELLVRDFVLRHDYATLIDTLDYLENLGVNAIELMPINEFDNNDSWGYNPAFFFAPDKYYGPRDDLKRFIDECHSRGIAVILDIVFNHAFGQNTMARLYMDKNSGKPTSDNPWFNEYVPHPFGYYNDFDHSSFETQYFVDRCLYFWLTEYKVDGYRLDLSKGFTQVYSFPNDIGLWGSYDADRVYWLKRMFNQVRTYDSDAYMILEHFADNTEETELANHGYMLWGNAHPAYKQAAMGYQTGSDFKYAVSSNHRGWAFQHLVGYMESHDEERIMYECQNYGNMRIVNGDTIYNIQDTETALKRVEMTAAFFYTVPGPKMLWQFGELGYDFSINFNGRTAPKPLRWNYLQDPARHRLYKAFAAMIKLKTENPAFRTSNYDLDVWGNGKRMWVTDPSMNVTVIGNFGVDSLLGMSPGFQNTGEWYDYMTGDTIVVTNVNAPIPLAPGEYHIYTNVKLAVPDLSVAVGVEAIEDQTTAIKSVAYPNPFKDQLVIDYELPTSGPVTITIFDSFGRRIREILSEELNAGKHSFSWQNNIENLQTGLYYYTIQQGEYSVSFPLVKMD
jgi:1,4-alpha-glucan branching enzyme